MNHLSITTIILTYNEEKHIRRCIENIYSISDKIYVVDSLSSDLTSDICNEYEKVEFIRHQWPGNQADQFNWALDNLSIDTDWILRLDADEYLSDALIDEISVTLPSLSINITGCLMKRDVIFCGKRVRWGKIRPLTLLRLWRKDKAYMEHRLMDEHVVLREGKCVKMKNYFFDDNLNGIDAWIYKHVDYADREAQMVIAKQNETDNYKCLKKKFYYHLPAYFRAWCYFFTRYVIFLGFLDGKAGFLWHFSQCLWYRNLVDLKLDELNGKIE